MKFLTGPHRIPVLGAPPTIEVNFKRDYVNGWRSFQHVLRSRRVLLHKSYKSVFRMKRKYYRRFQQH